MTDTTVEAPLVVYVVSEDWYFWSHRLAVAGAARDAGCRVAVVTRVNAHAERIRGEGFALFPLDLVRGRMAPLADLGYVIALIGIYRRQRPALVHHVAMKPVLLGTLAALLAGVPNLVNALAGLGFVFASTDGRTRWLRALVRCGFRLLLNRGRQRVIVQNAEDLAELRRLVRSDRLVLVPGSGVDTVRWQPLPEPPGGGPVVFAMVSRLLREKGVEDFVTAARALHEEGVCLRALLVGRPDPDNPNTCTEAELHAWSAAGDVEWLGHCEDIAAVWRMAHVCVLPSYYREGVPKTLLEAQACARAVITTDMPGCRDVVSDGDNGVLVPPRSPQALAAAMRRLAADAALRQRMGAQGRKRVEAVFAESRVVAATTSIYRGLLAERWPT